MHLDDVSMLYSRPPTTTRSEHGSNRGRYLHTVIYSMRLLMIGWFIVIPVNRRIVKKFPDIVLQKQSFQRELLAKITCPHLLFPTYLPRRSSLNRPIPFNGLVFGSLSCFTMLAIKTIKAIEQDQGAL